MDLGLKGRRALVLAATRGLGRSIAEALAAEGAQVTLCGRSGSAEAAAALGSDARGIDCDLHDGAAVDRLLAAVGDVDVLVLNGGGPPPGPALEIGVEAWRTWFERMVATNIRIADSLVSGMRRRGWGRLLTVGSSAAVQPIASMALSNSLRAGLIAWNKTLAAEVAADGVTCNVVLPGRIQTERVDALDAAAAERAGTSREAVRAQSIAGIPAGRYGRPQEFGAVAAFLCSEPASYVTGSVVRVDGGLIRAT